MDKDTYTIVNKFECSGNTMLVVRMNGAACVMPEIEYNRMIETERKYYQWKQRKNNKVA